MESKFKIGDYVYWNGSDKTFGFIVKHCNTCLDSWTLNVKGITNTHISCSEAHLRHVTIDEIPLEYRKKQHYYFIK